MTGYETQKSEEKGPVFIEGRDPFPALSGPMVGPLG
jgi:hypothetical protein